MCGYYSSYTTVVQTKSHTAVVILEMKVQKALYHVTTQVTHVYYQYSTIIDFPISLNSSKMVALTVQMRVFLMGVQGCFWGCKGASREYSATYS